MTENNDNQSFVHSLNLKDDISHFDILPNNMQHTIEEKIVLVIYDSFVISGDEDYLTSRLMAQKGLERAFFWAASQSIEKYLKAFLLFNGKSIIKYQGHPIKKLLADAILIDRTINNIDISPHSDICIDEASLSYLKIFQLSDFIDDLNVYGDAGNRYNSRGITFSTGHLLALDSLIFQLREKIDVPSILHSLKGVSEDLIEIFNDNNPYFCKIEQSYHSQIPSNKFPIKRSISVTTLDIIFKNKSEPSYNMALQWLNQKMKLPKSMKQ